MGQKEPIELQVKGRNINCPMCHHNLFWKNKGRVDVWATPFPHNQNADAVVCADCGYVLFFLEDPSEP